MTPSWIAVDWGTSACRAWAIDADGAVLAEARSNAGMGTLSRDEFEPALLSLVGDWVSAPTDVVACGMVGARQGWVEAPYTPTPCEPRNVTAIRAPTRDLRLQVHVLGGIRQDSPADVMRGEETQIAGVMQSRPGFNGVICLPGTHTKWVQVSAGEVVSFRTFMSGELFALLCDRSVLRHSVGTGWDDAAFLSAVGDAISRPEAIAQRLFGIRAESLLHGLSGDTARARLSGLLVGAELAAARPYWLGQPILIVGSDAASKPYATALSAQGIAPEELDADAMTRTGLGQSRSRLGEIA